MPRRVHVPAAVLALAAVLAGCGGGDSGSPPATPGTPARTAKAAATPAADPGLRLVALREVNGSGVAGTARLLLRGRRLTVDVVAGGVQPAPHAMHLHIPEDGAQAGCPGQALDADGNGLVSLEESGPAYGPPVVSLEPFPAPEGRRLRYQQTLRVPRGLPLDRAAVVVHGMRVRGAYDALLPIACAPVDRAEVRELALEPVNGSGIAGTARLARVPGGLVAWTTIGGPIEGREHMQHIHVPEGDGQGACPTAGLDADRDGIVSLEEGAPAYGPPVVSLEPFPFPDALLHDYAREVPAPRGLPLDRAAVVVHGMLVDGRYDATVPVACGTVEPTLPATSLRAGAPAASGAVHGHGYER